MLDGENRGGEERAEQIGGEIRGESEEGKRPAALCLPVKVWAPRPGEAKEKRGPGTAVWLGAAGGAGVWVEVKQKQRRPTVELGRSRLERELAFASLPFPRQGKGAAQGKAASCICSVMSEADDAMR